MGMLRILYLQDHPCVLMTGQHIPCKKGSDLPILWRKYPTKGDIWFKTSNGIAFWFRNPEWTSWCKYTPKFNIAPEKKPFWKNVVFQSWFFTRYVKFQGVSLSEFYMSLSWLVRVLNHQPYLSYNTIEKIPQGLEGCVKRPPYVCPM